MGFKYYLTTWEHVKESGEEAGVVWTRGAHNIMARAAE